MADTKEETKVIQSPLKGKELTDFYEVKNKLGIRSEAQVLRTLVTKELTAEKGKK